MLIAAALPIVIAIVIATIIVVVVVAVNYIAHAATERVAPTSQLGGRCHLRERGHFPATGGLARQRRRFVAVQQGIVHFTRAAAWQGAIIADQLSVLRMLRLEWRVDTATVGRCLCVVLLLLLML